MILSSSTSDINATVPRIGIFDSGVGGLTVLEACIEMGITGQFIYLADTQHMPYGEKNTDFVVSVSQQCVDWLVQQKVDYIITACNTAAAAFIVQHKNNLALPPALESVATHPAILDPITTVCQQLNQLTPPWQHLGLLATQGTVRANVHRQLLDNSIRLTAVPCQGLAYLIEQGESQSEACQTLIRNYLEPFLADLSVEAIILGCTHYPLVASCIEALLPGMPLLNPATLVAKQLKTLLQQAEKPQLASQETRIAYYITSPQAEQFYQVCQQLPLKTIQLNLPTVVKLPLPLSGGNPLTVEY